MSSLARLSPLPLCLLLLGGCAPLVAANLIGSAVTSLAGGGAAPSGAVGQAGRAFAVPQNSVQNSRGPDSELMQALDRAPDNASRLCLAQLPGKDAAAAQEECAPQLTCLPGMMKPMLMNVCQVDQSVINAPASREQEMPAWSWSGQP